MAGPNSTAHGIWQATFDAEAHIREALRAELQPLERIVQHCYEAGVQAASTHSGVAQPEHVRFAGLFLKRVLTDLRAAWLLIGTGYTWPAAAVVASLWENAIVTARLARDPRSLEELKATEQGDVPWAPMPLAKWWASDAAADSLAAGITEQYERVWRETYGPYKWLCKIKHPTMRSAAHESGNAATPDDKYMIMAMPDSRPEDAETKVMVIAIAITRASDAIDSFVHAVEVDRSSTAYKAYSSLIKQVWESHGLLRSRMRGPLPVMIGYEKIAAEYRKLRTTQPE